MRQKLVAFCDDFHLTDQAGRKVFKVDRKVLRVRDTYGVQVAHGQEDAIILAVTVVLDNMAHPGD